MSEKDKRVLSNLSILANGSSYSDQILLGVFKSPKRSDESL